MPAWIHPAALACAILLTAFSQVLLRSGAARGGRWWHGFLNLATAAGYALFVVDTLLMVLALQGLPLKTVVAWNALTFLLTPAAGAVLLREKLNARVLTAGGMIMVGILIFSV